MDIHIIIILFITYKLILSRKIPSYIKTLSIIFLVAKHYQSFNSMTLFGYERKLKGKKEKGKIV
jgi:hypothetical protein